MIAVAPETNLLTSWKTVPLSEAVDILDSRRVPVNRDERAKRPGKIPYYGATGQVDWIDDYLFDEELVLLGEDGAPFLERHKPKAYRITGKSWVNNHAHVLRARDGVDARFLVHALNIADYRPFVSGTTRLKLTQAAMRRIPITLPHIDEQKEIVAAIETQFVRLDDAVAALHRSRTRLKRYRASVLKAACEGRLVLTEAELARQEGRSYEPASVLLERIKADRDAAPGKKSGKTKDDVSVDKSQMPQLPEGWVWITLGTLLSEPLINGRSVPDDQAGFPVLRLTALGGDTIDLRQRKNGNWTAEEAARFLVAAGDFLVARGNGSRALVGRGALVAADPDPVAFPDTLIRIRTIQAAVIPKFLNYTWQSPAVRQQIESKARTTAGIYKINQQDISSILLALPPYAEQERVVEEVERRLSVINQMVATVETNLKRAESLRQSILRRAFSGRLLRSAI